MGEKKYIVGALVFIRGNEARSTMRDVRSGSWLRKNAVRFAWAGRNPPSCRQVKIFPARIAESVLLAFWGGSEGSGAVDSTRTTAQRHISIAAMSGFTPMMFITRVRL